MPPAPPATRLRIHLIGICGTGMGSLAGLLHAAGHDVRGSDESVYPPMSTMLSERGIRVLTGYRAEHLADRPDLVVVGNVASKKNPEAVAAVDLGLRYLSMPQAIRELFITGRHSVVVTGTHGKTTTSALMAWILEAAGRRPTFLVGGVLKNFDRSFALGTGEDFVVEGDEYETSYFDKGPKFMHYAPTTAILTSVEFDHAEMFRDLDAIKEAFRGLVRLVPENGRLIYCGDDPNVREVVGVGCRGVAESYGMEGDVVWKGRLAGIDANGMAVEVARAGKPFVTLRTPLVGAQNLLNILAVIAAAAGRGVDPAALERGMASFQGVRRRQEIRGEAGGVTVIDDFAHHPTAVRLTLDGLKRRYDGRRVWAIFEPRTNTSRRSVFQQDYARSFDAADRVLVAAVDHPERAPEGQRFSAETLVDDLRSRGLAADYQPEVQGIVDVVTREARSGDVLVVMSNGSFGGIHDRLLKALAAGR
ncbi:MAG TPA: UDP-N-acetylmuramate:L-alanyl-gamma-D-glutamyl-meso-diaminopimelate ligase [Candidatus Polarisedimenticolia bacterium]|nr:UDP-N-acetylmuramate:L-alanyl-gamma-D-glutamyl-meso-diaminopimelate ligase [Candidatus Polarisedimenticolia bacterium]